VPEIAAMRRDYRRSISLFSGDGATFAGAMTSVAPAATGVGETLPLFERRRPAEEQPELIEVTTLGGLPADPRL
jgi:hypothetical protein